MCYLLVLVLGLIGFLTARGLMASLVLLMSVPFVRDMADVQFTPFFQLWSLVGPPFITGALAARYASRIPMSRLAALASLIILAITFTTPYFKTVFPITGTYLVLYAAFARAPRLWSVRRHGDVSYGLYIWSWPTQQIIFMAFPAAGWLGNFALAYPVTAALAFLSWRLIEKPALARKRSAVKEIAKSPLKPGYPLVEPAE